MVRSDFQRLLGGFGKLVAVVVAAGLAGAGIGIALAKLTGSEDSGAPTLTAATSATAERASAAPAAATETQTAAGQNPAETATTAADTARSRTTTASRTQTAPSRSPSSLGPRVQVLSARLEGSSAATGLVTVRVRVINRGARPLAVEAPVLLSGTDEIPRDSVGGSAVRPLLRRLAAGRSATSVLRFTTASAVTRRLSTSRRARLRIARRSIVLKLAISPSS